MKALITQAENFVIHLLNENLESKFVYHNVAHTQRVVNKCIELAEKSKLTETEKQQLILAAWFHDTGFIKTIKNHEAESAKIAEDFLTSHKADAKDIEVISKIIMVTEMNKKPSSEQDCIIKDADSSHMASKNYDRYAALLEKEWELTLGKKVSKQQWLEENIDFFTTHSYHTETALKNWQGRKGNNLAMLLKELNKTSKDSNKISQRKAELKFKKEKLNLPDRGIETMFRVALRNHITLSDIADTKANILLSVNAIIISVALSNLIPKLDNPSNSYLIYPTLIFLVSTVTSIILSVMATRPNVTKGKFTKEDVANQKVNLLFFGNFHQMKLKDFEWAMEEMMKDKDYLYGSLTKDLYFLGLVLNRKYNLLRITYTVFMIGLIVSVIAFSLSFLLSGNAN